MKVIILLLEDLVGNNLVPAHKLGALEPLKGQLRLVMQERREVVENPADILVFACLLYTVCARAYEFVRTSGRIVLPLQFTILRACCSINASPATDQNEDGFLNCIARRITSMKPHERSVIVHEVCIEQYSACESAGPTSRSCSSRGVVKSSSMFTI